MRPCSIWTEGLTLTITVIVAGQTPHWTIENYWTPQRGCFEQQLEFRELSEFFHQRKWWSWLTEEFYQLVDWGVLPSLRLNSTSCRMEPTSLLPACEGLAQSELDWPTRCTGRCDPRDHNIAWSLRSPDMTPMDFCLLGSYQGQDLCEKLSKLGRTQQRSQ